MRRSKEEIEELLKIAEDRYPIGVKYYCNYLPGTDDKGPYAVRKYKLWYHPGTDGITDSNGGSVFSNGIWHKIDYSDKETQLIFARKIIYDD